MTREVRLTVYEPGEMLATLSKDGKVAIWTVSNTGSLMPSDNRLFGTHLLDDLTVEDLNLTVRTYNVLKREGIHTAGALAKFYDEKGDLGLMEIRNLGQNCVDEIKRKLHEVLGDIFVENPGVDSDYPDSVHGP